MLSHDERRLIDRARSIIKHSSELDKTENSVIHILKSVDKEREDLKDSYADIEKYYQDIQKIIEEKTVAFPWLTSAIAKYHELCDHKIEEYLRRKVRPADKKADRVKQLAGECKELRLRSQKAEFVVKYYESLFPWLTDYIDENLDDTDIEVVKGNNSEPNSDPISRYMAESEYNKLSVPERNQLALDRYINRKMSNWAIGREYERYVGYLYENDGYIVSYYGATEGLSDLGRDLIARRGCEALIIQCKYWASHKTIHEKHLFQLYGTTVEYWIANSSNGLFDHDSLSRDTLQSNQIVPLFVTSTSLSEKSKKFADALGIVVKENFPLNRDYPRVKCNVSTTGERIYHLPMDQQYDKVLIEPHKGEMYVLTIAEAEAAGFRRAWKWLGSTDS